MFAGRFSPVPERYCLYLALRLFHCSSVSFLAANIFFERMSLKSLAPADSKFPTKLSREDTRNVGHCDLYILRYELGNHAHEIGRVCPRRCHQRWLAESLPCITEIAEEILGQFVARASRPALRIAGLARLELGQLSA